MIYQKIPKNFDSRFEVVGCYLEHGGKILLLHRHDHKSEGGMWGVLAGKVNEGEEETEAILREVKEETGHELTLDDLTYITKLYVKYPAYDFVYHVFRAEVSAKPEIVLSETEHTAHAWVSPAHALEYALVRDLDGCIEMYYFSIHRGII